MPRLVLLRKVEVILDQQLESESDQHQYLIAGRESHVAQTYQVWSTSMHAFVSYLADTHTCAYTRVIPAPSL